MLPVELDVSLGLEEPRQVVQRREDDDEYDVEPGAAVRAEGPRPQRVAHGDEAFEGHRQREVDGDRLRRERERVHDRRDVREDAVLVREEVAGPVVDRGQPEEQDARDDEDGVAAREADQEVVDGRPHLRPGEDDHGDDVAEDAEEPDHVQQDAMGHELEEHVAVTVVIVRDVTRLVLGLVRKVRHFYLFKIIFRSFPSFQQRPRDSSRRRRPARPTRFQENSCPFQSLHSTRVHLLRAAERGSTRGFLIDFTWICNTREQFLKIPVTSVRSVKVKEAKRNRPRPVASESSHS